jgi:hypothetical protein
MADASQIKEHANVIGADGIHVGTVDKVEGDRIKLTKEDSPQAQDGEGAQHRWLAVGLVQTVEEDGTVRLSANAATAQELFEEVE